MEMWWTSVKGLGSIAPYASSHLYLPEHWFYVFLSCISIIVSDNTQMHSQPCTCSIVLGIDMHFWMSMNPLFRLLSLPTPQGNLQRFMVIHRIDTVNSMSIFFFEKAIHSEFFFQNCIELNQQPIKLLPSWFIWRIFQQFIVFYPDREVRNT